MDMQELLKRAQDAILALDADESVTVARLALENGIDPVTLMNDGFIVGIRAVGEKFAQGEVFMPELMMAGRAMTAVTDVVNEAFPDGAGQSKGTVVIATVKNDVHDIGKGMVISMLKANGYKVHDLGRDVSVDRIIKGALDHDAQVIGTSSLLTTTMPEQKTLEQELRKAGLRDRFRTVVGGAPVTGRWAAKIGADAYAVDAQDGVSQIEKLLAGK